MFEFKTTHRVKKARTGVFTTPHGDLHTPELAFVATEGEIKAIPKNVLPTLPVNLIIVNTFHLWTKEIIGKIPGNGYGNETSIGNEVRSSPNTNNVTASRNGLRDHNPPTIHQYSNFHKPVASDSGGFQVFSMGFGKEHGVGKIANIFPGNEKPLSDINNPLKITDEGAEFTYNNEKLLLTPEKSIQLQQQIGADIMFAFDECTSPLNSHEYTKKAMERTHRWLERCIRQNKKGEISREKLERSYGNEKLEIRNKITPHSSHSTPYSSQALFAIVQGGYFEDLRKKSAKFVGRQNVPGFGIGGSLGRSKKDVWNILEWIIPYLPDNKPRHLLGIGQVADIFESVERGVDLFDCVIPTREARHKILYTTRGKVNVRKMKTANEVADPPSPRLRRASKNCRCQMCQEKITYKQLYELYKLDKLKAFYYATVHNIQFYADLMAEIRDAIEMNKFDQLKEKYFKFY